MRALVHSGLAQRSESRTETELEVPRVDPAVPDVGFSDGAEHSALLVDPVVGLDLVRPDFDAVAAAFEVIRVVDAWRDRESARRRDFDSRRQAPQAVIVAARSQAAVAAGLWPTPPDRSMTARSGSTPQASQE